MDRGCTRSTAAARGFPSRQIFLILSNVSSLSIETIFGPSGLAARSFRWANQPSLYAVNSALATIPLTECAGTSRNCGAFQFNPINSGGDSTDEETSTLGRHFGFGLCSLRHGPAASDRFALAQAQTARAARNQRGTSEATCGNGERAVERLEEQRRQTIRNAFVGEQRDGERKRRQRKTGHDQRVGVDAVRDKVVHIKRLEDDKVRRRRGVVDLQRRHRRHLRWPANSRCMGQ